MVCEGEPINVMSLRCVADEATLILRATVASERRSESNILVHFPGEYLLNSRPRTVSLIMLRTTKLARNGVLLQSRHSSCACAVPNAPSAYGLNCITIGLFFPHRPTHWADNFPGHKRHSPIMDWEYKNISMFVY